MMSRIGMRTRGWGGGDEDKDKRRGGGGWRRQARTRGFYLTVASLSLIAALRFFAALRFSSNFRDFTGKIRNGRDGSLAETVEGAASGEANSNGGASIAHIATDRAAIAAGSDDEAMPNKDLPQSPACFPHWRLPGVNSSDNSVADTAPIKRIYFYKFKKGGSSGIRDWLKKIVTRYGLEFKSQEGVNGLKEEVGSRDDTIYVTNMRDPVQRSISHYKYEGRWHCSKLMNSSFVPMEENARPFEEWSETSHYDYTCEEPFNMGMCAVNCYLATWSGRGCTTTGWRDEYVSARDRLLRYNLIVVTDWFGDPAYRSAIESFFGGEAKNFGKAHGLYWCGPQSYEANEKVPAVIDPEAVEKLKRRNEMDTRLYEELVESCHKEAKEGGYPFPKVNVSRFVKSSGS